MRVFIANLLWFLTCLPGYIRFRLALRDPRKAQARIRRRCLGDEDPLPTDYHDYETAIDRIRNGEVDALTEDPVTLLEPTSGSTGGSKLIPYNRALAAEYQAAIAPWIASLYLAHPSLFFGRQYWSISPNTDMDFGPSAVPIGFNDDSEYLGPIGRRLARWVMAVDPAIRSIADHDDFLAATAEALIACRDLRLLSVWHPSFLTILFKHVRRLRPDVERMADLWPKMSVISCWAGPRMEADLPIIRREFPGATIQAKGLLATEGVVTIPWGSDGRHLPALRSHFYEFEDDAGKLCGVDELQEEKVYSVLISTGGGLRRYRLGDRVRVAGRHRGVPVLDFVGRGEAVSDLVGEKLHLAHVETVLGDCDGFAMLAPDGRGYTLFAEAEVDRDAIERALCSNYHYAHARELGQLEALRIFRIVGDGREAYRREKMRRGTRMGDVKFPALDPGDAWHLIFDGQYWNCAEEARTSNPERSAMAVPSTEEARV